MTEQEKKVARAKITEEGLAQLTNEYHGDWRWFMSRERIEPNLDVHLYLESFFEQLD